MKFTYFRFLMFILWNAPMLARAATQNKLPFVCEAMAAKWNNGILNQVANEKGYDYTKLMGNKLAYIEVKASCSNEFSSMKSKFGNCDYFHFIDLRTGRHAILPHDVVKETTTGRKGDSWYLTKERNQLFEEYVND